MQTGFSTEQMLIPAKRLAAVGQFSTPAEGKLAGSRLGSGPGVIHRVFHIIHRGAVYNR